MRKLIILPGICDTFGGTVITLSFLMKGFEQCGYTDKLRVLVQANSVTHQYFQQAGQHTFLVVISAQNRPEFIQKALKWINQQPKDNPLLLDNCVDIRIQIPLLIGSTRLRLSGRPIYHFCHDLALSWNYKFKVKYNYWGYLLKKLTFTYLAPKGLCNSSFTATHVRNTIPDIRGILYQPVDTERFNSRVSSHPPTDLQPILESGAKIILTPSRISQPGILNDKNLQTLIPMLAYLKATGHFYHSVVIGQDLSPNQIYTHALRESAEKSGVGDRLTILPSTFAIEDYYKYATAVVTLAPREPFGRAVIEGISCGIPVIGSHTGGIGEILSYFAPNWMVEPNDPITAAEKIIRVANDPNTPKIISEGKKWVQSECSIAGYTQKIMAITGLTGNERSQDQLDISVSPSTLAIND